MGELLNAALEYCGRVSS